MKARKVSPERIGPRLSFFFEFREESDYGQEVLELLAMVSELADPEAEYNKIDVNEKLSRIAEKVRRIKFDFFRGIKLA